VSGSFKEEIELRKLITAIFILAMFAFTAFPVNTLAGKIKGTVKVKGLRTPADIVVYIKKATAADVDVSKAKFVMDQQNLEFIPHVLPIPVGSTVLFPNNDKVDHNVFSMSRTKKFNLGSYKPGESKKVVFDKPGIVEMRCDVHAEMAAYILVMKNPYFAVTDEKGNFAIPDSGYLQQVGLEGIADLPPGKYFVKTRHEKLKTQKQSIIIPGTGDVTVQLDLKRGVPSVLYK
jgi:plastocyanin